MGTVHALDPEVAIRAEQGRGRTLTTVLGGTFLTTVGEDGDFVRVRAFGHEGWVRRRQVGADDTLRLSFIDVGQGDGCLVETPDRILLVDGGKLGNVHRFLTTFKYGWLLDRGEQLHLDAVVVSHFDEDHFRGVTRILEDDRITVGALLHNGIARVERRGLPHLDTELGETTGQGDDRDLVTTFDDLASLGPIEPALKPRFRQLVDACRSAQAAGRLGGVHRVSSAEGLPAGLDLGDLGVEVLGPVPRPDAPFRYRWLEDPSHTVNGHSVVLRLTWAGWSALLGGDINAQSEPHLLAHHPPGTFRSDVFKACHHGSSEFTREFLQAVEPRLSIISSGDNETYGHPQADLVGALGQASREGDELPLVFSTELARSVDGADVTFGMINVRCRRDWLLGAQLFEARREANPWITFVRHPCNPLPGTAPRGQAPKRG